MPIEEHRKNIGQFHNKAQKGNDQKNQQRQLNRTVQMFGHYPVAGQVWSPLGLLYILSIAQNVKPPQISLPNRQRAVQETKAAFEVDTFAEVRQLENQFKLHSFASSSTANPQRFLPPIPSNTTGNPLPVIEGGPSANPLYYLADMAHRWSIGVHRIAHGIAQLENCTTTGEVSNQNPIGLLDRTNHTQTHFKTICQSAVAKAQETNEQPKISKNIQKFHFKQRSAESEAPYFTAKDAAEKLKTIFQATVDDYYPSWNETTKGQGATQESSMVSRYWEEMTDFFTLFFSEPENATFTKKQESIHGHSVMDYFFEWLSRTFSVNHDNATSANSQIKKEEPFHFIKGFSIDFEKTEASLEQPTFKEAESGLVTQLWALANKLVESLDEWIKKWDPVVVKGAEAAPIPKTVQSLDKKIESSSTKTALKTRRFPDTDNPEYDTIIQLTGAIAQNIKPTGGLSLLPIFYYEKWLYQNKNQTAHVNEMLKTFFVDQKLVNLSATDLELIEVVQRWAGRNWKNEESLHSERAQYLAYRILKGYGSENARLGDFLSDVKLQSIYKQWKTNTLLRGYAYKKITAQTKQYDLSPTETPTIISLQSEYKIMEQIYADFIHERPASVAKTKALMPIYYHSYLFEMRNKTLELMEIVEKFLNENQVYLNQPTPAQLVSRMQQWILDGKRYEEIVQREKKAATMLLIAYGMSEKMLSVSESRAILLQWENNHAQFGYTFKQLKKKSLSIDISKIKQAQESARDDVLKQKIDLFLRENDLDLAMSTPPGEEPYTRSIDEKEENVRQRVATFLSGKGVSCHIMNANLFAEEVSQWVILEGANQKIIDREKVKQIAQVILNEKVDGVISNEHAEITFTKWLWELIEFDTSELTVVPRPVNQKPVSENTPISSSHALDVTTLIEPTTEIEGQQEGQRKKTTNGEQWRSPRLMKQVECFFRDKDLLAGEATKEAILSTMGKWFIESAEQTSVMPEKIQAIASVILKELKLYGGGLEEVISDTSAEQTVMKWVFENVLGCSIEAYIAKNIVDAPDPSTFTLGHLRELFTFEELKKAGFIKPVSPQKNVPVNDGVADDDVYLRKLWLTLSNRALPHYLLKSSNLSDKLLISDYGSLTQLTGASLLQDLGFTSQFNQTETRLLGEFFIEAISLKGLQHFEELSLLLTPAIITVAQLEPDKMRKALVNGNYLEVALTTFISYSQKGYFQLVKTQEIVDDLVFTYQQAVINWRRKLALVDDVLGECERLGIRITPAATQVYLAGGNPCPGPWIPPDLEKWYTRLTKDVTESYHLLNQFLIQLSINSIQQQEHDFLFSPDSRIYEASAQFRSEVRQYNIPTALGPVPPTLFYRREELLNTTLQLDQTDLIVAIKGKEERIYALKQLKEGGYKFYRVDKDPFLYLVYGLMDKKELWDGQFRQNGEKIRIGKKDYTVTINIHKDKEFVRGSTIETLSSQISLKHKDALYQQLYASGNEQTTTTKAWNVIKHLIPFYDCVVGIADQNVEEAVPNCLIDAVSLIPVLGQVNYFNMRFALGVAKSVVKSGVSTTLKTSARFLPTLPELRGVFVNVIRYFDPGVEMVAGGGQFILKRLIHFRQEEFIGKELKTVLTKLAESKKQQPDWTKNFVTARLTTEGPEVCVKRMQNQLYLKVNDLRNGDVYGKYFTLRGDQLREFEGPASFTQRQKVVIQRLARTLDVDQIFVEEINLYPKAYGEGKVFTFKKKDGQRLSAIQMDGQLVPVQIQVLKKHGVRYDVYDGEKYLPVNFNGIEWYFEPLTAPVVSKSTNTEVTNRINQFEALWDPRSLSAPDDRGLMWSAEGRSYIKINERYLPLILLDKETNRYHLVKKDILEPMTILRFDPNERSFRLETELERETIDLQNDLRMVGTSEEPIPSTSSGIVRSSQGEAPSYPRLPKTPGRWKEWNDIRQAVAVFYEPPPRVQDSKVVCKKLSAFIPEPKIEVILDEQELKQGFSDAINLMYHSQPVDYKVFTGLTCSKVPDYLKPYVKKVSEGFYEAIDDLKSTKERCIELLKLDNIDATREGQYAVEMFDMYLIKNREPYLREVFKRLLSVSEKSERILRQSADWGFENIWIVSTELEKNEAKQVYYSKVEAMPRAYAFVMGRDPECCIVFIADTNHLDPGYMPKLQLAVNPKETILHEATHLAAMSYDVVSPYPYMVRGFSKSGADVRNLYMKRYKGFFKTSLFANYVSQVAESQNAPELAIETVIRAEDSDAMMSMNIQMLDAETLMTMIRDIAKGNPFNQRPKVVKRDVSSNQDSSKMKINVDTFIAFAVMKSGEFYTVERSAELKLLQNQPAIPTVIPNLTTKPKMEEAKQNSHKHVGAPQSKKKSSKPKINKLIGYSIKNSSLLNVEQATPPVNQRRSNLNLR